MGSARIRAKRRRQRQADPTAASAAPTVAEQSARAADEQLLWAAFSRIQAGDHDTARQIGCEILAREPQNADAWHIVGMALHCSSQHDTALQALDQAIAFDTAGNGTIRCTRGSILCAQGRHRAAVAEFRLALRATPQLAEAARNLATSLITLAELEEAEQVLFNLLQREPDYARAWSDLSTAQLRQQKFREALRSAERALALDPREVVAHLNLGLALLRLQRTDEAIVTFRDALQLDPRCAAAYHNLGGALCDLGHVSDAVQCYRAAKELAPSYTSDYLFALGHDPSADEQFVASEHRRWGQPFDKLSYTIVHNNSPDPARRLRIGYVSADYRDHVMSRYLLPVFKHHNRDQFEVFAYSAVNRPDHVTTQFQSFADHWRPIWELDDQQLVHQIRQDQIDLLVDVSGHTAGNRLSTFAYKPAPIQITWLGYSNTTGLQAMDYRIANAFQDPPESSGLHCEQLLYVDGEGVCYEMPQELPAVTSLPARHRGYVTFGSLHRLNKLTPQTLDVWCAVLSRVAKSRMIVFWPTLKGDHVRQLQLEFQQRGIEPERVELRHEAGAGGYLAQYHDIDIALDVTPWTGSTTTREALAMGTVVLALCGQRRSARGSATVLHYAGLDQYIAYSAADYVELASQSAQRIDELDQLRNNLRHRVQQTIGNHAVQMRQIERCLREVWTSWCEQR